MSNTSASDDALIDAIAAQAEQDRIDALLDAVNETSR